MRAAHANCNSNDATSKSDGDGNSHATAAITVSDNNRYANPHAYLDADSARYSHTAASAFASTAPLGFVDEKERHYSICSVQSTRLDLLGSYLPTRHKRSRKHHHGHKHKRQWPWFTSPGADGCE